MKRIVRFWGIGMICLLALSGCGSDDEYVSDGPITVTVYNNSTHELSSLLVGSSFDEVTPEEVLEEPLEPGESIDLTIPDYSDHIIVPIDNGEEWYGQSMREEIWVLIDGDLIVISDEYMPDCFVFCCYTIDEALQKIEDATEIADTDPDTQATEASEISSSGKDPEQMAQELGYDTLEDMRFALNDIVYISPDENVDVFSDLYGYWYPDGDKNSLTYLKVENGTIYWYTFEEGVGDVQTDYDSIKLQTFSTFKTYSGRKLEKKTDGGIFGSPYILFEGDDTKYYYSDH